MTHRPACSQVVLRRVPTGLPGPPGAHGKGRMRPGDQEVLRMGASHFKRHVFFCLNERAPPDNCCANHGSAQMQAYAKDRVKKLGISGAGKVRVNKAGCLDRCDEGPCLVVYPEAVWYTYVDQRDIDEIIDTHLVGGAIVERLRLP